MTRFRNTDFVVLLLIGTLCLIIILNKDGTTSTINLNNVHRGQRRENDTEVATKKQATDFHLLATVCETNASAANITGFSKLPKHIQNFLFYRHCRQFSILLDVPNKCGGAEKSSDVFLLLVIKSLPLNFDRRQVLRKTWAEERLQSGVWIRRLFITGTTGQGFEKQRLSKLMAVENQQYNDIVQWDFDDTFFNLTLKQILFLEWMEKRCPHLRFILNGDDDIFANTDNMIDYLKGLTGNDGNKHLFVGHLIHNVGPIREPRSKYYIPVQVQSSDYYPSYCGGGGFLLSGFTARVIFNMSHSIMILPIDDVYMGMCLEKAGLQPVSHFGVRTAGLPIPSTSVDSYDACYYREILLVHRFLPHHIFLMWHDIHDPNLKC